MARTLVFDLPGGSQILVEVWDSGPPTLAIRQDPGQTWGPPIDAAKDETWTEKTVEGR